MMSQFETEKGPLKEYKDSKARYHVLSAMYIFIENRKEAMEIICNANNPCDAQLQLEIKYGFDKEQSQSIIDMRVKQLTSLPIDQLKSDISLHQSIIEKYEADLRVK